VLLGCVRAGTNSVMMIRLEVKALRSMGSAVLKRVGEKGQQEEGMTFREVGTKYIQHSHSNGTDREGDWNG